MPLWRHQDGSFEVMSGSDIMLTIVEAIGIAQEKGEDVEFLFADIPVKAQANSDKSLIYAKWRRKLDGFCMPPFSKKDLDD